MIHADECDEEIWEDAEESLLLPGEEIAEKDCPACIYEWALWTRIVEDCGEAWYGFWALDLMRLNDYVERFGAKPSELTAEQMDGLRVVRAEIERRQAFRNWQATQQTQKGSS